MSDLSDLTSFVGRQAEVDQAGRQLSVSRLVTLTGPGGAGKTRLATRLAQDYVDDARFIALDSLRDPGLLAQTVAAELGLRDVPDEPTSRVVEFLKDKSLLLVLDNCEHMVQPAEHSSARSSTRHLTSAFLPRAGMFSASAANSCCRSTHCLCPRYVTASWLVTPRR